MESLLFLLGLLLLALPVIAIVALTRTITLGAHFRHLDARLAAIERGTATAIRDEAVPAAALPPAPPPIPPSMEEAPQAAVPPTPEPPARTAIAAPRPAPGAAAPMSLEQRLGTQWTVWVGGLALALGGIFLVRYSIEQGLLGHACDWLWRRCWPQLSSFPASGRDARSGSRALPASPERTSRAF